MFDGLGVDAVDVAHEAEIDLPRLAGRGVGDRCTGRRWTVTSAASMPDSPMAGTFALRRAASRSALTVPAKAIFATSRVSASVTRRPATISGAMPSRWLSSVACWPPPWTSTILMPSWCSTAIWSARLASAGPGRQRLPPSLTTKTPPLVGADVRHRDAQGVQGKMEIHEKCSLSPRFPMPELPTAIESVHDKHGGLRPEAVFRLIDHHATRIVEGRVGDFDVPPHRQTVHQNRRRLVQVPRADHPRGVLAETGLLGLRLAVKRRAAPTFHVNRVGLAAGGLLVVGDLQRRARLGGTTPARRPT